MFTVLLQSTVEKYEFLMDVTSRYCTYIYACKYG